MFHIDVAVVHNTIAPYRHPLFEKLSKTVTLVVYYCSAKSRSREWDLWPRNYDYEYKVLPRIPIGEFSFNPSIIKELIKNRPHAIVVSGYTDPTTWLVFILGTVLKIPLIYWTEGIKEPPSILGTITKPLRIFFNRKYDAIVVPGKLSKDYVINFGAKRGRVFIAPNTIDNELFVEVSRKYQLSREELKGQLGLRGKLVILYVGQLIRRKGIEYLLYAYGKLEQERANIALTLVGSGSSEPCLRNLANSLELKNIRIIHSGLSLKELIKLYSTSDIFVLPTLDDIWGFVINEAMACRLPIVATSASQAAQEMIRSGKNGYVVKEADSEELYSALENLICDSDLREKMASRSRKIVQQEFDVSHMVKGFLSAIKHCTNDMRK
jgi:glycosyltransferase involved in cell wall biosynthesis